MHAWNSTLTPALIALLLLAAVWLGGRLRRFLPEAHLNAETKDTVKLSMGLVATMSALLLGLLVSSAKGAYDATRGQVIQMAAKIAFLDRILASYGPEAAPARAELHDTVERAIHQLWARGEQAAGRPALKTRETDHFLAALHALAPKDDTRQALKTQALALTMDLGEMRMLLLAQAVSAIPRPLLAMVVVWLFVIFISFSLIAAPNRTAVLSLAVSALAAAAAIGLILELDRPFSGLIQIPSQPMESALEGFAPDHRLPK